MRWRALPLVAGLAAGALLGWSLPLAGARQPQLGIEARCSEPLEERSGELAGIATVTVSFRSAIPADREMSDPILVVLAIEAPEGWQMLLRGGSPTQPAPGRLRTWGAERSETVLPGRDRAIPLPAGAREVRAPIELTLRAPARASPGVSPGVSPGGMRMVGAALDVDGRLRQASTVLRCRVA